MSYYSSQDERSSGQLCVATIGHRFPDATIEVEVLRGSGIEVLYLGGLEKAAALDAARQADAVLLGVSFDLDAEALRCLRRCRAVVRYGVGVDNVDLEAAAALGMTVSNVPDYGVEEVANHTIALLLLFARRLDIWASAVRTGQWGSALPKVTLRRLSHTALGVIGAGRIGRAVIARAKSIWTRVLVYDPWINAEEIARMGAEKVSLENLLKQSDFVTLHAPSSAATKGLLSEERLRLMKQGAILVNCARGDLIDEATLTQCVIEGHISGVGLDVFAVEPPPLEGLLSLPNVWPTPHVAWLSAESIRDLRRQAAEEARRILLGQGPWYAIAVPRAGPGA